MDEIEVLKEIAKKSRSEKIVKETIVTMSTYGEVAIPAILEIINNGSATDKIKRHGLAVIKKIKEKSR